MNSKEDYIHKMQAKLEEWNTEIDQLIARAGEVTEDVRNEYNDQIEALKALLAVTRQKFEDVQQVGEIAWEIVRSGIDLAWTSMEEAMEEAIESAKARFRDK